MPDIKTIILAGGKGTRLAPYTTVLPKPLMPVCDMPILEIVVRQLRHYGFRDITISVGHLAELLMAFFGDGSKWGVKIQYVVEDQPLGTIGPTRLINDLTTPFMVMNGDLLTDIDYSKLYEYHTSGGQSATVATATREVQISLGVLDVDDQRRLVGFREKPKSSFQVSMGIYMFNPSIIRYVPPNVNYGFDKLMLDMLAAKDPVRSYPFGGLWLDIGRHEDYALATDEFEKHRDRFLPGGVWRGRSMQWKVPLFETDFGAAELEAVQQPVKTGWLTMGELTQRFEKQFAEKVGVKHAFAVNNCTAGLHLIVAAAGIGPGDEVICPTLTFVATANSIKYVGATPVFAESVGETNLNIGPEQVAARITPRTKAILVVHYAGFPVDMPGIMALAQKHKLIVLEDCAHALFSRLQGRMCGAWGQSAAFSFFGNKNMTCGEGGMVTTDDDAVAEQIRYMRSHGMTTLTFDRFKGRAFTYDVVAHGYNYRMDEIRSALCLVQMERLPKFLSERERVRTRYIERLNGTPVHVPNFDWASLAKPGDFVGHHIMPVLLPAGTDKTAVATYLKERGIQTSVHYHPVHTFTAFQQSMPAERRLSATEALAERELTLPMYPTQSNEQVELVCDELLSALRSTSTSCA